MWLFPIHAICIYGVAFGLLGATAIALVPGWRVT
jgi:hypothetical protein